MDIKQWGWMLMRRFLRAQMIHNQFNRQPPGLQDDSLLWNACFMSFSLSAASLRGLNCQGEAGQFEIPPSFSVSAPLKPDGRPPPRRRLTRSGARFFFQSFTFSLFVCAENHEPWRGGAGSQDTMKTSLQVLRCQLLSEWWKIFIF